jgi:hypothetical protein
MSYCHPCSPKEVLPVAQASNQPTRMRRAESDPDELPAATTRPMTRRIAPPKREPVPKEPRIARSHDEVMRMLDETVARRMVYEAATQQTL